MPRGEMRTRLMRVEATRTPACVLAAFRMASSGVSVSQDAHPSSTRKEGRVNGDIEAILERHGSKRTRLVDILWDVQHLYGHIPPEHLPQLGAALDISPQDVWETASFYHFFHGEPSGKYR